MIKKLRLKFVCVIMSIVMVLLGGILGVAIHFTRQSMENQSISMMRTVASIPFEKGNPGTLPRDEARPPVFVVQINGLGEIIVVEDGGYFDLSDRTYLQEIVNGALRSDRESGRLDAYDLRYLKILYPMGYTVVFSETTAEDAALNGLLYNCLLTYILAAALFLVITIGLSHWVIRPVEDAWEQQRQFVADASHELKTPLSIIMANAELLNGQTAEGEIEKFSGNILSMTYQMRSLVENMLEMARVDNEEGKMPLEALDLSQLVCDAALSFRLLYEEQGLNLRWEVPEGLRLHGSGQHLYQVMDVLLDNALKYSAPGGLVSVELKTGGRSCVLSVASPGEPIAKEDLKNIFKRFYRADKARAMNGSYGLGLSIAEAIVQAHKGKIWAESENGINTFFVQLPLN